MPGLAGASISHQETHPTKISLISTVKLEEPSSTSTNVEINLIQILHLAVQNLISSGIKTTRKPQRPWEQGVHAHIK